MNYDLIEFIKKSSFPCIMAKSVATKGNLQTITVNDIETIQNIKSIQEQLYEFIDNYRANPNKLHSFVLTVQNKIYDFERFEKIFWDFLTKLHEMDKRLFAHDPRVSSDSRNNDFSFSLKEEAFFILLLHPQSPRWSRRFKYPAIVFNPHQQFEKLRVNGTFTKIRDIIRRKDKLLQGNINPMLDDFGNKSEVFQYTGRAYSSAEDLPIFTERVNENHPTTSWSQL